MLETSGNIWDFHSKGEWIVITTNGSVRRDGCCVMGRGVAREAATRFPSLPSALGACIKTNGPRVQFFSDLKLFAFPVKHHWSDTADMGLIELSSHQLVAEATTLDLSRVYLVRPGCGNGHLQWKDVKPVISRILDSRFIVVNNE